MVRHMRWVGSLTVLALVLLALALIHLWGCGSRPGVAPPAAPWTGADHPAAGPWPPADSPGDVAPTRSLTYLKLAWVGGTAYTNDGVDPDAGLPNTRFVFGVRYLQANNVAPSYVRLRLWKPDKTEMTGSPFDMTAVGSSRDWKHGVVFTRTISLSTAGIWSYQFTASDGSETTTLPPDAATKSGPMITGPSDIGGPGMSALTFAGTYSGDMNGTWTSRLGAGNTMTIWMSVPTPVALGAGTDTVGGTLARDGMMTASGYCFGANVNMTGVWTMKGGSVEVRGGWSAVVPVINIRYRGTFVGGRPYRGPLKPIPIGGAYVGTHKQGGTTVKLSADGHVNIRAVLSSTCSASTTGHVLSNGTIVTKGTGSLSGKRATVTTTGTWETSGGVCHCKGTWKGLIPNPKTGKKTTKTGTWQFDCKPKA